MKLIAFSLFGEDLKYHHGARANLKLIREFYPGWQPVFFVDNPNHDTIGFLSKKKARIVDCSTWKLGGLYWRHCVPNVFPEVERYLVRDADSRISYREAAAVEEWIESGKTYHLMRDHPNHTVAIMQGMYGAKGAALACLQERLSVCPNERNGAVSVLEQVYREIVKDDAFEHGEFYMETYPNQKPFPVPRMDHHFVGEIFDHHNKRNGDWERFK